MRKRKVADVEHGEKVAIPTRGISEPIFHHNRRTGRTEHVVPGNKEYVRGDEIPRPRAARGSGGREGSPDGGGEDAFEFTLSKEEFLDMFFEDLELPDLVKKSLKETLRRRSAARRLHRHRHPVQPQHPPHHAQQHGAAHRAADGRSCRRSRRSRGVEEARARGDDEEAERLTRELERIERRSKIIPYIDPIDVRYQPLRARAAARTPRRSCSA